MRNQLLIGTALAALVAGISIGLAQDRQDKSGAPMQGAAPATQNAPAEKIAPPGGKGPGPAMKNQSQAPANEGARSTVQTETGKPKAPARDSSQTKIDNKADAAKGANGATSAQTENGAAGAPSTRTDTRTRAQQPSSRTDVNVNLTTAQRTRIHDIVVKQPNAPRMAHVDFSLNVGAVVPSRVRVVALPPQIVEIHPAWRGYMYFMAGSQIVIVEPGTLRIVEILPA